MTDTIVIIPTLCEKENIKGIIEAVFSQNINVNILVVDDNSEDGTIEIVQSLISDKYKSSLFLEIRKGKRGLGAAYIHGLKWGLEKGYDYFVEMDADFSHNPKDLLKIISPCKENISDLVVGSRYLDNKINVINWDFKRLILSYMASKYVKFITGIPIFDTTAGFVCYTRKVLETIDLDSIKFIGYAFQIEMKFKAWKHGFRVSEESIIFTDREKGKSKMNGSIIFEAVFGVLKMKIKGV
ncbi:MAG: polyprenol monophosphomannose synthase [Flavobacteriaceae bacterium]|nr:polyprenol monophosphomannose synthase [Flavobacteriaceae bacterium]